jgi:hypothetical protein
VRWLCCGLDDDPLAVPVGDPVCDGLPLADDDGLVLTDEDGLVLADEDGLVLAELEALALADREPEAELPEAGDPPHVTETSSICSVSPEQFVPAGGSPAGGWHGVIPVIGMVSSSGSGSFGAPSILASMTFVRSVAFCAGAAFSLTPALVVPFSAVVSMVFGVALLPLIVLGIGVPSWLEK